MKNLKVKFAFFSLLTMLAVSVLLVSCEQNDVGEIVTNSVNETNVNAPTNLTLPADIYDKGEAYVSNYLATASDDLMEKLQNNYIVATKLEQVNKINSVIENEPYGFHFSDIDLSKYLSDNEVSDINLDTNISPTYSIEYRACLGPWEWCSGSAKICRWNGWAWCCWCR